jgi:hypothetical protein
MQSQKIRGRKRDKGANFESGKNVYLENTPRRAPVDSQRLVQSIVDRGVMVSRFLPQRLFGLGLLKMSWRRAGMTPLLLWGHDDDVRHGQDSA